MRPRLLIALPVVALVGVTLWVGLIVAANIGIDLSLPAWLPH